MRGYPLSPAGHFFEVTAFGLESVHPVAKKRL